MKKISVRQLLLQAFLTGWEQSGRAIEQDEYLESAIHVIETMQVEPECIYVEEGFGLLDGNEVDHLDDLVRADGAWLYYGVETDNFFLLQWYDEPQAAEEKLVQLQELGEGTAYLVDFSLKRKNASQAENFGDSSPNHLHS